VVGFGLGKIRCSVKVKGTSDTCPRQLRVSAQDERSDLHETLMLAAAGKVKPKIELYPLARANEVRERLQAGKVRYRAVLQHQL
jgi:D-arabinose 1-dehydrogenase-like Zn-dependent alcohol dehydrogenase